MSRYRLSKALGEIDERLLEEVFEYSEKSERRRISMNKKIFAVAAVAAAAVGIMAVTAYSKEPIFRPGVQVLDPDAEREPPVTVHDASEIENLPPNTPFVIAPDADIVEEVVPLPPRDFEMTYPEITDVVVEGSDATIYWTDPNEAESHWDIGICVNAPGTKKLDTVGETSEMHYTLSGLEPGEYFVVVGGLTPDEGDPAESVRLSSGVIFTVE